MKKYKIPKKCLDDIENIIEVQTNDPASQTDSYMQGMANGMIMLKSIIDRKEPRFLSLRKDRSKMNNSKDINKEIKAIVEKVQDIEEIIKKLTKEKNYDKKN